MERQKTSFTTSYTGHSAVGASQKPLSEKFPEASEMFWQEHGNSSWELLTMTMLPFQSRRPVQPQHSIYRQTDRIISRENKRGRDHKEQTPSRTLDPEKLDLWSL